MNYMENKVQLLFQGPLANWELATLAGSNTMQMYGRQEEDFLQKMVHSLGWQYYDHWPLPMDPSTS